MPYSRARLRLVIFGGIALLLIVYVVISRFGYDVLTQSRPFTLTGTPTSDYTDITFPSRGHSWLVHGFYIPGDAGRPALINIHGYRSTRRAKYELDRSEDLHALGYTVLSIDLKDNGGDTVDNGRLSMGYNERWDALGAFDYLLTRGFTPSRIGLVAESMGATTSLLAAAAEPNIRAVWADSPYSDTYAVISENAPSYGFSPIFITGGMIWGYLLTGDRIWEAAPIFDAATIAAHHQSIYLIHDEGDETVLFHHSRELYNAYRGAGVDVTFWDVPGLDHAQALTFHRIEYLRRLDQFFSARLDDDF